MIPEPDLESTQNSYEMVSEPDLESTQNSYDYLHDSWYDGTQIIGTVTAIEATDTAASGARIKQEESMSEQYAQICASDNNLLLILVCDFIAIFLALCLASFIDNCLCKRINPYAYSDDEYYDASLLSTLAFIITAFVACCIVHGTLSPEVKAAHYIESADSVGIVTVIDAQETAKETKVNRFEIQLEGYQNDPSIIVDKCEFDEMPAEGEKIGFEYSDVRFDGSNVHLTLTNWWVPPAQEASAS